MSEKPMEPAEHRYPGRWAREAPERVALIHGPTGWRQTYRELDDNANRFSTFLREVGADVGDHVVILLNNHERFLEIAWGCHYAGLIYTACATRLTASEVEHIVRDCGARVMVTGPEFADVAAAVADDVGDLTTLLTVGESFGRFASYEELVHGRPVSALPEPRAAGADMLYSSGTTGRPKGVARVVSGQPLETSPVGVSYVARKLFGFGERTVYLCPAPLYHAAGIKFVMATHALGGTAVIMGGFDAEQFLELADRHAITHTQVVPTMMLRMSRLSQQTRDAYDLSSIEYFIHSAAPCPPDLKRTMIEWLGPVVFEYYAGTESNGVVACSSREWLEHPGTVGRPIGCEIHICADDGTELPAGEVGTVFFGGGQEFEYHGDSRKTAGSRHPRGWSTLGDVGRLDEDGFLYLTDRKAFMIISGGVNVYPQEAENVLATHPKVVDAAVFGVPNEEFGEEVKAVVQPVSMPDAPGDRAALEAELIAYCRTRLSSIKCPRSIDLWDELPRDPSGKMRKQVVRQVYLDAPVPVER